MDLLEKYKDLEKQLVNSLNEIILEKTKPVFEGCPNLKSFSFYCYTPYFNDGDVCNFRVEFEGNVNGTSIYNLENTAVDMQISEAVLKIQNLLSTIPTSLFERCYGNDQEITITKDSVTSEHWDDHE